jgi:hypothetical protein
MLMNVQPHPQNVQEQVKDVPTFQEHIAVTVSVPDSNLMLTNQHVLVCAEYFNNNIDFVYLWFWRQTQLLFSLAWFSQVPPQ